MYPYKSSKNGAAEELRAAHTEAEAAERGRGRGEVRKGLPPSFRPPKTAPGREHSMGFSRRGFRRCEGHLAYLWLRNDKEHWMYVTHAGAGTVFGYTWTHNGWRYTGFDTRFIEAFYCFG